MSPINCKGYAVTNAGEKLVPWEYEVRDLKDTDLRIDIKFCGICRTDIHMIDNDWKCSHYPLVPGHEITGIVKEVGKDVKKIKVGDRVGVGYQISSCGICSFCNNGKENYCKKMIPTSGFKMPDGELTRGGFSNTLVVSEKFCVKIPESIKLDEGAPLFCAGITVWSPMKHWKMDKGGLKIGVVGLGGLGHMAIKFGVAFGNEVFVLSHSPQKEKLAKDLGATEFILLSKNVETFKQYAETMDYIIDTVSVDKPLEVYLSFLKCDGVLVTVGLPTISTALQIRPFDLISQRKTVSGSLIGSIKEIEEMIDFCVTHNVRPNVKVMPAVEVNEAIQEVRNITSECRIVLNMLTTN